MITTQRWIVPLLALLLSACNAGGITGSEALECDADLLRGSHTYDASEDLSMCERGRRPLGGG